ncbi:MAG: hypothetical protein ACO3GP_01415 [Candidatus Limnocylindrus sp.]
MRRIFHSLWRLWRSDFVRNSSKPLPPDERRQVIADLLYQKFDHVSPDDVRGLVNWAINFSEMSDDYLQNRWMRLYDCP